MPEDAYDPASIRFPAGIEPPKRRDAGRLIVGDDLSPEERAARLAAVIEMLRHAPDVPPDPGDELP